MSDIMSADCIGWSFLSFPHNVSGIPGRRSVLEEEVGLAGYYF